MESLDPRNDRNDGQDETISFDPVEEARDLRGRKAAAGIPGLRGFALLVTQGPCQGQHWPLPDGEHEAGRNSAALVFLDDVTVSRHHAAFAVDGDDLTVRDLGSTNGTYFNGSRVASADLRSGDEVIVGRFHLVVTPRRMTSKLSIGEVINHLKKEFPDVTVSKLRFLESEGLISPRRSRSGYREFRDADVERVRYILRQQRDHFLPLKVIKSKLTAWERGEEPTIAPASGAPPETSFATSGVRMSADELARAAGVPIDLIERLVEHGVLAPRTEGDAQEFDDDHLAITHAAHRLVGHGLEACHLRSFRVAANRETDLFSQLTGPLLRHRSPANRRHAAEILADSAQAARELQDAMVRAQLRRLLEG